MSKRGTMVGTQGGARACTAGRSAFRRLASKRRRALSADSRDASPKLLRMVASRRLLCGT
eukprot:5946819-Pleurochrysis_carterae.AAC.1